MARSRRSNTQTGEVKKMSDVFAELDDAELAEALSGTRQKGMYDDNLLSFLASGRRGVEVNLTDGIHAGKKPQSIKTGYESAREKVSEGKNTNATDEDTIAAAKATRVILKNDRVFLIRQAA